MTYQSQLPPGFESHSPVYPNTPNPITTQQDAPSKVIPDKGMNYPEKKDSTPGDSNKLQKAVNQKITPAVRLQNLTQNQPETVSKKDDPKKPDDKKDTKP